MANSTHSDTARPSGAWAVWISMSRLYFHMRQGEELYRDLEGMDYPSLEEAVARAHDYARAIMQEHPSLPRSIQCIEIADEEDTVLRMIPFEIVPSVA